MADMIKEVLINYPARMNGTEKGYSGYTLEDALAEIKRIVSEAKPDKAVHNHPTRDYCNECMLRDARNLTIDEYHNNLLKALGE